MLQYSTFGRDIQKIYCFSYINTGDLTIYTKTDTPVSKQPEHTKLSAYSTLPHRMCSRSQLDTHSFCTIRNSA